MCNGGSRLRCYQTVIISSISEPCALLSFSTTLVTCFLPSQPLFEFDLLCLFICLPTSLPPYFAFVFGALIPVINLVCLVIDQYHTYLYYLVLAALLRLKQNISHTDISRHSKKQRLTLLVPLVGQRGG